MVCRAILRSALFSAELKQESKEEELSNLMALAAEESEGVVAHRTYVSRQIGNRTVTVKPPPARLLSIRRPP